MEACLVSFELVALIYALVNPLVEPPRIARFVLAALAGADCVLPRCSVPGFARGGAGDGVSVYI